VLHEAAAHVAQARSHQYNYQIGSAIQPLEQPHDTVTEETSRHVHGLRDFRTEAHALREGCIAGVEG